MREITYLSIIIRVLLAIVIGGALGLERGLKNRPAGLRTYMLVCMGSCLIMLTNQYIYQNTGVGDPVRLGAQVVSGIGFLGAGTIVVTKHNQIKGLTTAAGLWASAAVGLALGVGFYEGALLGGISVFVILTLMQRMDDKMRMDTRNLDVYIEIDNSLSLAELKRQIRELDVETIAVQLDRDSIMENDNRAFLITLKCNRRRNHIVLTNSIQSISGVLYVEEL